MDLLALTFWYYFCIHRKFMKTFISNTMC